MGFRKPKKAIGLDIGTHAVKAVLMSRSMGRLRVEQACCALVDRNQLNTDPMLAQSLAVLEVMEQMPAKSSLVVASLTGQTVVVRYPRLIDVPREQLASTVAREASNNIPYDLNDVFMDWYVLDEYQEESRRVTKVLIVAAMREVVESRLQLLRNTGVSCGIIGVDSLALADAGDACKLYTAKESVAIIDIGLSSSSIQFIKGGVSNFIRDVNWGARELIQAVTKAQRCSYEQAVSLIENYQASSRPSDGADSEASLQTDHDDVPLAEVPNSEERSYSPLDPLDDEEGYGSGRGDIPLAMEHRREVRLEEAVSGPLNRFAIELRRSFDYYEHQLYEHPVDRILLCGGLAKFPLLMHALEEELGFGVIDIVSPARSALHIPNKNSVKQLLAHPAQYIVAIGLAARGMADL